MNILEWANMEWPPDKTRKNVHRYAELLLVNGNDWRIKQFGKVTPANNLFGRIGLTMAEAFELTYMAGIVFGLSTMNVIQTQAFEQMLDREKEGNMIEIASPEITRKLLN